MILYSCKQIAGDPKERNKKYGACDYRNSDSCNDSL
nr:MAG TPA: hypothetical protein [Caudoviricetes sp.]DAX42344.1 MAG TPA: hypothetical protein [Caudoviricetes sp.]